MKSYSVDTNGKSEPSEDNARRRRYRGVHNRLGAGADGGSPNAPLASSSLPFPPTFHELSTTWNAEDAFRLDDGSRLDPHLLEGSSASIGSESTVPAREPPTTPRPRSLQPIPTTTKRHRSGDHTKSPRTPPTRHRPDVTEDTKTASSFYDNVRKAGVTVAGSAMVGIGLVLIPLPIPFGLAVATSGLALLGTEYPEALEFQDRIGTSLRQNWDAVTETIRAHLPEPPDVGCTGGGPGSPLACGGPDSRTTRH